LGYVTINKLRAVMEEAEEKIRFAKKNGNKILELGEITSVPNSIGISHSEIHELTKSFSCEPTKLFENIVLQPDQISRINYTKFNQSYKTKSRFISFGKTATFYSQLETTYRIL
jgi:hypothetical protein